MRLARSRAPRNGLEARAYRNMRCLKPSRLHQELAHAVDDHDRYRELQHQYGGLLQPDVAGIYGALADAAASRAQTICDQITAAGHATPLVLANDWGPKNTGKRLL